LRSREPSDGLVDVSELIAIGNGLIETGIFDKVEARGPLFRAAYTQLAIINYELIEVLRKRGYIIDFEDFPIPVDISSAYDFLKSVRNAASHPGSGQRWWPGGKSMRGWFVVHCRVPPGITFSCGDYVAHNDYDDDIVVVNGQVEVLIHRHMLNPFKVLSSSFTDEDC
jgi:hypothetical protein